MVRYVAVRYRDYEPRYFIYKSGILNDIFTPMPVPPLKIVSEIYNFIESGNVGATKKVDLYTFTILK